MSLIQKLPQFSAHPLSLEISYSYMPKIVRQLRTTVQSAMRIQADNEDGHNGIQN